MSAPSDPAGFRVRTIDLDLPALAGAFSQRLQRAGLPMTVDRGAGFARALTVVKPITRRRLYWTARAVFVSDKAQVKTFDSAFFSVFWDPGARSTSWQGGVDRHLDLVGHLERPEQRRVRLDSPSGLLDGGAPEQMAVLTDHQFEGDWAGPSRQI